MTHTKIVIFYFFLICGVRSASTTQLPATTVVKSPPAVFNGLNIPWNSFGNDFGSSYDPTFFETYFEEAEKGKQNIARIWVHCDGRASPTFTSSGSVAGLSSSFLGDLVDLVSRGKAHHIVVQLCLWSFDMCKAEAEPSTKAYLIRDTNKTESYITNALVPMLATLRVYNLTNAVLVEVINEPEWCMEGSCSTVECVSVDEMQRFVGLQASAVRANGFKVTVGSASLKWNGNAGSAEANYWADSALTAASGSPTGYLDLYNIHYYDCECKDYRTVCSFIFHRMDSLSLCRCVNTHYLTSKFSPLSRSLTSSTVFRCKHLAFLDHIFPYLAFIYPVFSPYCFFCGLSPFLLCILCIHQISAIHNSVTPFPDLAQGCMMMNGAMIHVGNQRATGDWTSPR